jgi:hypothetical protein
MARDRTDIDDVASAALDHSGEDGPADVEKSLDVRVDHLLPIAQEAPGELLQAPAESGVVDQNVDPPPFVRERGDGLFHGRLIPDVQRKVADRDAELLLQFGGQLLQSLGPPRADEDLRLLIRERPGAGAPDPRTRSRDEYDLIL